MKIIFLSNSTWNIYNFRRDLINHLNKNNNEIHIVAPDDYNLKEKIQNIKLIKVKLNNRNYFYDLIYIIRLIFIFQYLKPDLILSYNIKPNIFAGLVNFFFKYKIIANVTGLGSSLINKSKKRKFIFFLYKISFKNISHIFFQNPDDRKIFSKLNIAKFTKSSLVPGSGINLNNYNFNSNKVFNNKFIYVGRLLKDKGVIELMEAIKIISKNNNYTNLKFIFIGRFDENNPTSINEIEFMKFVNKYDIDFYPFSDNIIKNYNQSDALILPSYREGSPKVMLEAMSLGVNIITSNAIGCRHIIKNDYNGLVFLKKNKHDLVKSINKFIALDKINKINMLKNARYTIEKKYKINILIEIYDKKINEILND